MADDRRSKPLQRRGSLKNGGLPAVNQGMDTRIGPTANRLGLSTSQAARHLGVSLSTIRRWSDMGHLRGYRTPGGQRRFTVEQLDAFLSGLEQQHRLPEAS